MPIDPVTGKWYHLKPGSIPRGETELPKPPYNHRYKSKPPPPPCRTGGCESVSKICGYCKSCYHIEYGKRRRAGLNSSNWHDMFDSPNARQGNHGSKLRYLQELREQTTECAICGTTDPGGKGTWSVDHDHETQLIRDTLCNKCNVGIGFLKDDPLILRRAALYLEEWRDHHQVHGGVKYKAGTLAEKDL